ncbi:Ig-like domain-containing protein [Undibacterium sp. 14-3-2]|uniref:beta strand repeat-containing protein n=1 Tax=Undibacterium sp. 14-3-2 TaxID=2800129 RepID=UPI0019050781|nr:Ig-like domain-containing protein [Undibacterium sp. 14-3-2]MBK1889044.1 Ig-like domain-containing protein [Undibacterium sp. 14-3-2]
MNILKRYLKPLACLFAMLITTLVAGCGGGGGRDPILGLPAATLSTITVSPVTATIPIGGVQKFLATATYSDGASQDVTAASAWSSGTTTVATVNATSGVASGVIGGTAVITASFGGKLGSATLTVSPASLLSIKVLPVNPSIPIAAKQQFTAMGTFSDGTTSDISAISTFTSASQNIATITNSGLAAGVIAGNSVIAATSGTKTGSTVLTVTPAVLLSIAMTPVNPILKISTTQQLTMTASYTDGTSNNVTALTSFTSAAPTIASLISTNGLVTAVAAGSSLMTGTVFGKSATTTVTVSSATLSSIVVTPPTASIATGSVKQFIATGNYTDGSSADISSSVKWTSGTASVAIVLPGGAANGLSGGTSTITATLGSLSGTAVLTVVTPAATLSSITVTPPSASIAIGATQAYIATGNYSDGTSNNITNTVTWSSGTTSVATIVSTGIASGIASGTSVITATSSGKSGTATLTVQAGPILSLINVTPATSSVAIGGKQSFIATGVYSNGVSADITNSVTWASGTSAIATVSPTGVATGVSLGTTAIIAISGSKSGTAVLTVLPAATLTSIAVTPAAATIAIAATQTFVATATYSDGSLVDISNIAVWSSANPAVATVLPGGISSGVSGGSSVIAASLGGKSGSATLTVTPAITLTGINITPINPTGLVGSLQQFNAIGNYSNGTTSNITATATWLSSVTSVATILPSGQASALAAGVTNISATQGGNSAMTSYTVNAVAPGINLGGATNFAVLAGTSITNNAGGITLVTGDVGSPSQTVDPVQTAGFTNYKSGAILTTALADLQIAITDANSRPCDVSSPGGIDLGGQTLAPGVYCYAGAITITGTFNMNGSGLYIFRTASTLNSTANSIVALNAGATADNVFWVPLGPTTLGANSVFKGTIMAQSAAITLGDTATLQNGRVLSGSAVTLKNNVISR